MAKCPVCQNPTAEISSSRPAKLGSKSSWFVKCPNCPTKFVLSADLWNLQVCNRAAFERRRRAWTEMLRMAKVRGDFLTNLY